MSKNQNPPTGLATTAKAARLTGRPPGPTSTKHSCLVVETHRGVNAARPGCVGVYFRKRSNSRAAAALHGVFTGRHFYLLAIKI